MTLIRRALFANTLVTLLVSVALSETALCSFGLFAAGRDLLSWSGVGLVFALLTGLNSGILFGLRRAGRDVRWAYHASRVFMVGSLAALFGGAPLLVWFALRLAAQLVGADSLGAAALLFGGAASVALGAGSVLWGYFVGQRRLEVERVELAVRDLPPALRGLRIAHLSDLHIGNQLEGARLRRFVERTNELEADLVAITGDIFDFDPRYIDEGCRELAKLSAPHGVFAILGNHDHYTGANAVERGLRSLTSIALLRDEKQRVDTGRGSFWLLGIDDPGRRWTERDSESLAMQDLAESVPAHEFHMLLAHRPSYFRQAIRLRIPLVLSGHTHGGQITLPSPATHWNVSRLISHWTRGAFEEGGSTLYVNRGLGVAGPPVRLNCAREIALLELVPREAHND